MTRNEFIDFLKANDIPFEEYTKNGLDQVWVYDKKQFEKKKLNPVKNRNMYVPYLRVSNFDGDRWYTRENGWTCYMNQEIVINKCLELGA